MKQLTEKQRLEAYQQAKQLVIQKMGSPPSAQGKHKLRNLAIAIVMLAAFVPSSMRLFSIGQTTFATGIAQPLAAIAAGIAIVLLAETGQILFSVSLADVKSKADRRLMYLGMAICTAIALIGNIQFAMPGHWDNPFAWLEAIAPPVLVLLAAQVLKNQILAEIEALHRYQAATANPEDSEFFPQMYYKALEAKIYAVNTRGSSKPANERKAILGRLDDNGWKILVKRELVAQSRYENMEDIDEKQDFLAVSPSPNGR